MVDRQCRLASKPIFAPDIHVSLADQRPLLLCKATSFDVNVPVCFANQVVWAGGVGSSRSGPLLLPIVVCVCVCVCFVLPVSSFRLFFVSPFSISPFLPLIYLPRLTTTLKLRRCASHRLFGQFISSEPFCPTQTACFVLRALCFLLALLVSSC